MKNAVLRVLRPVLLILICAVLLSSVPSAFAQDREEQLEAKISQIIAGIPVTANSDVKVALYLHDYIVHNVDYQMVGDHQTAYGALLDGKAVCAGYADAYQRLLNAVGIRAYTIRGTADNGDGNLVGHAWTMLYLEGKCVFTDVTWDDPFVSGVQSADNITHTYFQLSMEEMNRNHFPDAASKALLPSSCDHTGFDYYSIMRGQGTGVGIFNNATTPQQAAPFFQYQGNIDGQDVFFCDFRFDDDGMLDWISRNWVSIAQSLGLSGSLGVSYQYSDNTAKVTLKGTLNKKVNVTSVSVTPSALSFNAAGMTAQLTYTVSPANATDKNVTYTSSDPSVATVSETGIVTAKGNGTAVITVRTNDGGKTATCRVTVSIPAPTEPTETTQPTEPAETTMPPVVTEPSEPTEPPVTTHPVTTIPSVPTEPAESIPATEETTPSTQPVQPTVSVPTVPEGTQIVLPTEDETDPDPAPSSRPATKPPVQPEKEPSSPVMTAVLITGGALVAVFLLIFILRRRA